MLSKDIYTCTKSAWMFAQRTHSQSYLLRTEKKLLFNPSRQVSTTQPLVHPPTLVGCERESEG